MPYSHSDYPAFGASGSKSQNRPDAGPKPWNTPTPAPSGYHGYPTHVGGPMHEGRMHVGTMLTYALIFGGGWFIGSGGLKKFLK